MQKSPLSGDANLPPIESFLAKAARLNRSAETVREQYPGQAREIIAAADLAMKGMHVLPGTGGKPYFVGNPVDWTSDPVNDNEYVWALNRMSHWPVLGKAMLLTGEKHYGRKIIEEWMDWIARCPPPDIATTGMEVLHHAVPWRILEVGIRNFNSWPQSLSYLCAAEILDTGTMERIAGSVEAHGKMLSEFSPRCWPEADHNHFLMEMLGLLSIACHFPHIAEAGAWKQQAARQLERCMAAQLTPEGGQVEGCPHYHNGCMKWFGDALILAREHGADFSAEFREGYRRGVEYSLQATRSTGIGVPWGDSDADLHPIGSAYFSYLVDGDLDALRVLRRLSKPEDFARELQKFIWESPEIPMLMEQTASAPMRFPERVRWHHALHQVTVRSGWERESTSIFFACRTPVNNAHAHIDPGSFDFTAFGKALVVDPGRFTYREDMDRYDFKRAASHNMLLIDERDPFEYQSSWRFGPQRDGRIIDVTENSGIVKIIAQHENYHPAIHRRTCFLAGTRVVVLVDVVSGLKPEQMVQLYFHVDSTSLSWDEKISAARTHDAGANVLIAGPMGLDASILDGRTSDKVDIARMTKRLRLGDSGGAEQRTYKTLVIPFMDGNVPKFEWLESDAETLSVRVDGEIFRLPIAK